MSHPRRHVLPLLLALTAGCTSVLLVGDRDDASVATAPLDAGADAGLALDRAPPVDAPTATDRGDAPMARDLPDATTDDVTECPFRTGGECIADPRACRLGRVACARGSDGGFYELCEPAGVEPAGRTCRHSTGVCDPAETCDGVHDTCPDDRLLPAGTICGGGTAACPDPTCTGSSGECVARGSAEVCDGVDNDCDGRVDEDLTEACYLGPAGTAGVGLCRAGRRACAAGAWGGCADQVLPTREVCDGLDNDCNGQADNGVTCP